AESLMCLLDVVNAVGGREGRLGRIVYAGQVRVVRGFLIFIGLRCALPVGLLPAFFRVSLVSSTWRDSFRPSSSSSLISRQKHVSSLHSFTTASISGADSISRTMTHHP